MKLPKQAHIVVMERDLSITSTFAKEGAETRGPITWETYLDRPITKQAATEQGQRMSHQYGKFIVCKLVPVAGTGYVPWWKKPVVAIRQKMAAKKLARISRQQLIAYERQFKSSAE